MVAICTGLPGSVATRPLGAAVTVLAADGRFTLIGSAAALKISTVELMPVWASPAGGPMRAAMVSPSVGIARGCMLALTLVRQSAMAAMVLARASTPSAG